ncbi:MAG: glycosyltransferase [bacterium]|nr:glycosyltransferase [bacterium]
MKALFLYTELAEYFLKCCEKLSEYGEVHIIRWPVNKEAPFEFTYGSNIKVYDKIDHSPAELKKRIADIDPSIIICSGWVDKDYLKLTRNYFGKIPTVMTCDTHWKGSAKQILATILSRLFLLNTFSHAWVPGKAQLRYVRKLGFRKENTREGFYSCDLEKFNSYYKHQGIRKQNALPKRFLYVGRYYEFKGIQDLWNAFIQLQLEEPNDWELWCLGIGDLEPVQHTKIKHLGFVQPKDLEPIIDKCSVFILPSKFEPWGVVVQEYAASGFPLILSEEVGAGEIFLEEGKNGYGFKAGKVEELKAKLKKMVNLSSKELISMSQRSHVLAQQISPELWANTVKELNYEKK